MDVKERKILLVLPLAYQDGMDKYNGINRFLRERDLNWNIRLDRGSPAINRPTIGEKDSFDGAILDGCASTGAARAYAATSIPLVAIDWRHPEIGRGRRHMVRIDSDNAEIGRKAAETLSATGHFASFAFVPQADATIWSVRRGDAFARALRRQKAHVATLDVLRPLAPQLRALPKPSALFAASDLVGDRVLLECSREGIAVPDDLSVLGVDNEQLVCLHTRPPLASIQPDFERAGYLAAAALESMLEGKRARSRQLYHLKGVIHRQSLQSARSAGRLVQRALELINDSYSSFSNVDGLARSLGVSRRLLDLRFRQVLAKSVHEAIVEKRLDSVCRMLATTDLSIAEICAASGIGTGTHPQRAFKLRLGMTMNAYRRQTRSQKKAASTAAQKA